MPDVVYEVEDFIRARQRTTEPSSCGEFDKVQADFGQTGDLAGLDRAIAALTAVRCQLAALYGTTPPWSGRGGLGPLREPGGA
jgi:hypothetical protein